MTDAAASAVTVIERGNAQTAIGDPKRALVLGYDAHLTEVSAQALSLDTLMRALANAAKVEPATVGDGNRFAGRALRAAAVLIPLVQRDGQVNVLLTQRASHLRDHAGQIAFPGGGCDVADVDAWATALREAREEVGLQAAFIRPLGQLPVYTTVTAFQVTPCVGWLAPEAAFELNADEVDSVFEVPLAYLMKPAHHERRSVQTPVGERVFYAIPCTDTQGAQRFVWGATAGMLRNLYRVLAFELKLQVSAF